MMRSIARIKTVLVAALVVVATSFFLETKANAVEQQQDFVAPFLKCTETANQCINTSESTSLIGSDPLTFGESHISATTGDLKITVVGAKPNKTYDVFYISTPGASFPIDSTSFVASFTTDGKGKGTLLVRDFFPPGDVDSAQALITEHTIPNCSTCTSNCCATEVREFITGYKIKK